MLQQVGSQVVAAIKATTISSFPRISPSILQSFSTDIALVSIGIRTAYLLDLFSLPESAAREFIANLRKELSFRSLVILYHKQAEQSFFVNTALLRDRLKEATDNAAAPWTNFLILETGAHRTPYIPSELVHLCQLILKEQESMGFNTQISSLSMPHTIALAGFLLEYPISYFPSSDSDNRPFLSNIPLDVFGCSVTFSQTSHVFMRFSRPAGLDPSVDVLSEMIQQRFQNRLYAVGIEETIVDINHRTMTMDRIAL